MSNNLLEQWKTDLFQDNALNKLFDQNISPEDFVFLVLNDYNIVQVGDIFSKLTAIHHNIHGQMDTYIKKNCEEILEDIKEVSNIRDISRINPLKVNQYVNWFKRVLIQSNLVKINLIINLYGIIRLFNVYNHYQIIGIKYIIISGQALFVCKELQKFTQQMKIISFLAQTNGNQLNIVDPLKVAHILSDLNKLPKELKNISIYKKSEKYIQQVQESVSNKVDRKFQDALNSKNFPEISGSLSIYYALGQLPGAIENKANELLKSQLNSYKQLFSKDHQQFLNIQNQSKQFHNELRLIVKEDFNYALQIFLIYQALTQRDPHDFVAYEEVLAPDANNLFDLFWDKMCSIVQSTINLVVDNKAKYDVTYKIIINGFPKILELYQEYMFTFNEQLLLFPSALLTTFSIPNYYEKFLNIFNNLKSIYLVNYKDTLTTAIKVVMNEVATVVVNNPKQYQERCQSAQSNLVDVIRQEFLDNIKLNPEIYQAIHQITITNLTRMYTTIQSKVSSDWPVELQLQILTIFPAIITDLTKIILDHKLNNYGDFNSLEQLLLINSKLFNSVTILLGDNNAKIQIDNDTLEKNKLQQQQQIAEE